jgi:hypothetical protein
MLRLLTVITRELMIGAGTTVSSITTRLGRSLVNSRVARAGQVRITEEQGRISSNSRYCSV